MILDVQSLSQKGANQFQNFKLKKLSAGADGAKVSLQNFNSVVFELAALNV
jgi:hypothetical protein